jgi:hypothetical protein
VNKLIGTLLIGLGLIMLNACSMDVSSTPTDTTTTSTPATPEPVQVFPEAGQKLGVIESGKSVKLDFENGGLRYKCKAGLKPIVLNYLSSINYNGTKVEYISDDIMKGREEPYFNYSLKFSGDLKPLASDAVSLIVESQAHQTGKGDLRFPNDDHVINLTPEMFDNGIALNTTDFNFIDGFSDMTFCVKS